MMRALLSCLLFTNLDLIKLMRRFKMIWIFVLSAQSSLKKLTKRNAENWSLTGFISVICFVTITLFNSVPRTHSLPFSWKNYNRTMSCYVLPRYAWKINFWLSTMSHCATLPLVCDLTWSNQLNMISNHITKISYRCSGEWRNRNKCFCHGWACSQIGSTGQLWVSALEASCCRISSTARSSDEVPAQSRK